MSNAVLITKIVFYDVFKKKWRHCSQKVAGTVHRKSDILRFCRISAFHKLKLHPLTGNLQKKPGVIMKNVYFI